MLEAGRNFSTWSKIARRSIETKIASRGRKENEECTMDDQDVQRVELTRIMQKIEKSVHRYRVDRTCGLSVFCRTRASELMAFSL